MDILGYRMTVLGRSEASGSTRLYREFAEWTINDVPLGRLLASQRLGYSNVGLDFIPAVSWNATGDADVERLFLRRPADLPSGRHSLLVCPVCGDTGCTCVSTVIERSNDTFIWHSFGWENSYDEDAPRLDDFLDKGPLRFDAAEYERVLREMNVLGVAM